ncbi:MAG: Jag N-terminal domain-containing protein, partial [Armatimonadetes bacterium]|nr:Jag N-terminal domain-containing protein [Armatimonadota bacterium]
MESTEQTGRSVDEAVETALRALGVSRDQVEVEVLSEEKRGLLGILGSSSAKVRVTVKGEAVPHERKAPQSVEPELEQAEEAEEGEEDEYEEDEYEEEDEYGLEEVGEPSELAERATDILHQIITLMGLKAEVKIVGDDPEAVSLDIRSAEDLGLLIG